MLRKKTKLATNYDDLLAQREVFLEKEGLEPNEVNRHLFAVMIQHLPEDQDWIDFTLLGRRVRKALANEAAYYLLHPAKYQQMLVEKSREKEQQGVESAPKEVGKEAQG